MVAMGLVSMMSATVKEETARLEDYFMDGFHQTIVPQDKGLNGYDYPDTYALG